MSSKLYGAVDIGSNATRWAIGTPADRGQEFNIVMRGRAPTRLGEEVFVGDGAIPEKKIEALVKVITEFQGEATRLGVGVYRVVATSALREATNREHVVNQVYTQTGARIEVIEGIEEARLVHTAVNWVIPLSEHSDSLSLLVDIGGGSVEVSLCEGRQILSSHSVQAGGVRLISLMRGKLNSDSAGTRTVKLLERLIRQFVGRHVGSFKEELRGRSIDFLVGTGGELRVTWKLARVSSRDERST